MQSRPLWGIGGFFVFHIAPLPWNAAPFFTSFVRRAPMGDWRFLCVSYRALYRGMQHRNFSASRPLAGIGGVFVFHIAPFTVECSTGLINQFQCVAPPIVDWRLGIYMPSALYRGGQF